MAFPKGSKLYCNADAPITTIDGGEVKNNIPFGQEGRNSQDYYGDTSGRSAPIDILWQPATIFGVSTGRTALKDQTLYYEFAMKSSYRISPPWGSTAGGLYLDIDRSAWVSSEFCTDSETSALDKYDKRTDKATITQIKNSNLSGKPPVTGSGGNLLTSEKKNNTLIFGGIGLTILVFCIWFFGFRKS